MRQLGSNRDEEISFFEDYTIQIERDGEYKGLGYYDPALYTMIYSAGSRTVNSGVVVAAPTLLLIFS
jgi:hypothetical protein